MIPVTSEEEWLIALSDLPSWQPPAWPLVLIAPHPDDETLGAGCLLADHRRKGIPVNVVAVTDGEAAFPHPNLAAIRRDEQEGALSDLGVDSDRITRLGLPDGGVDNHEQELRKAVAAQVTSSEMLIVAPWSNDAHPDHEACGRVAESVAREMGAILVTYFFWTWHKHAAGSIAALPLVKVMASSEASQRRAVALARYKSQLEREDEAPPLPALLLKPSCRPYETFAITDLRLPR